MNVNHSELCFEKGHFLVNDFFSTSTLVCINRGNCILTLNIIPTLTLFCNPVPKPNPNLKSNPNPDPKVYNWRGVGRHFTGF